MKKVYFLIFIIGLCACNKNIVEKSVTGTVLPPLWQFNLSACLVKWNGNTAQGMSMQNIAGTAKGKVYVYAEYVEIVNASYSYSSPTDHSEVSEGISRQISLPAPPGVISFPAGNSINLLIYT